MPRSRLRDVVENQRMTSAIRRKLEGIAALEEDYRDRETDADFEARIVDKAGINGVGPDVLERYGEHMDPSMRAALTTRAAQYADARASYDRREQLEREEASLRARAGNDPQTEERSRRLRDEIAFERGYRKQVRDEMAEGTYQLRDHGRERAEWAKDRAVRESEALRHDDAAQPAVAETSSSEPMSPARRKALERQQANRARNRKTREEGQQQDGMGMG